MSEAKLSKEDQKALREALDYLTNYLLSDRFLDHQLPLRAAFGAVGTVIMNIPCPDCRALAAEAIMKRFPQMVQLAMERAEKEGSPRPAGHVH
jgi:hypothetical protein